MSPSDAKPRVALYGLGLMGAGMARRLLGAGFPLAVYNRSAAQADALRQDGAEVAASPRDAANGAAIAISMVADDSASCRSDRRVLQLEQGRLSKVGKELIQAVKRHRSGGGDLDAEGLPRRAVVDDYEHSLDLQAPARPPMDPATSPTIKSQGPRHGHGSFDRPHDRHGARWTDRFREPEWSSFSN